MNLGKGKGSMGRKKAILLTVLLGGCMTLQAESFAKEIDAKESCERQRMEEQLELLKDRVFYAKREARVHNTVKDDVRKIERKTQKGRKTIVHGNVANDRLALGRFTMMDEKGRKETGYYIKGLTNTKWDPDNIVEGRGATEDQIQALYNDQNEWNYNQEETNAYLGNTIFLQRAEQEKWNKGQEEVNAKVNTHMRAQEDWNEAQSETNAYFGRQLMLQEGELAKQSESIVSNADSITSNAADILVNAKAIDMNKNSQDEWNKGQELTNKGLADSITKNAGDLAEHKFVQENWNASQEATNEKLNTAITSNFDTIKANRAEQVTWNANQEETNANLSKDIVDNKREQASINGDFKANINSNTKLIAANKETQDTWNRELESNLEAGRKEQASINDKMETSINVNADSITSNTAEILVNAKAIDTNKDSQDEWNKGQELTNKGLADSITQNAGDLANYKFVQENWNASQEATNEKLNTAIMSNFDTIKANRDDQVAWNINQEETNANLSKTIADNKREQVAKNGEFTASITSNTDLIVTNKKKQDSVNKNFEASISNNSDSIVLNKQSQDTWNTELEANLEESRKAQEALNEGFGNSISYNASNIALNRKAVNQLNVSLGDHELRITDLEGKVSEAGGTSELPSSFVHVNTAEEWQEAGDAFLNAGGCASKAGATGSYATAIGYKASAPSYAGIALGSHSVADREAFTKDQVYLGQLPYVQKTVKGNLGAVSIGNENATRQLIHLAAGTRDTDAVNLAQLKGAVTTLSSIDAAIYFNLSENKSTLTAGNGNQVSGNNNSIIGSKNQISGCTGNIFGQRNQISGRYDNIIGNQNEIAAENVSVLGDHVRLNWGVKNTVVLGNYSTATESNVISVGSEKNQRRIVHVAAGVNAHDAVNVAQLEEWKEEVQEKLDQKMDKKRGRMARHYMTLLRQETSTADVEILPNGNDGIVDFSDDVLHGVGDGEISATSSEAINGSQLYQAKEELREEFSSMKENVQDNAKNIQKLDGRVKKVGALSAALAGLHPMQYDEAKPNQIMAAVASYRDSEAVAVGATHYFNEDLMVNAGVSVGTEETNEEIMGNLGFTWKFGKEEDRRERKATVKELEATVAKLCQEKREDQKLIRNQAKEMAEMKARLEQIESLLLQ